MGEFKKEKDVGMAKVFIWNEAVPKDFEKLGGKEGEIIKTEKPRKVFIEKAAEMFEIASQPITQEELEAVALTLQKCEKTPETIPEIADFVGFWLMCGRNTWQAAMEKSKKK